MVARPSDGELNAKLSEPPLPVSVSTPPPPVSTLLPLLPGITLLAALPVPLMLPEPGTARFSTPADRVKLTEACTWSVPWLEPLSAPTASAVLPETLPCPVCAAPLGYTAHWLPPLW